VSLRRRPGLLPRFVFSSNRLNPLMTFLFPNLLFALRFIAQPCVPFVFFWPSPQTPCHLPVALANEASAPRHKFPIALLDFTGLVTRILPGINAGPILFLGPAPVEQTTSVARSSPPWFFFLLATPAARLAH